LVAPARHSDLAHSRRKAIVAEPFPKEWVRYLETNVGHYRFLCEDEQSRLRDLLRIFIAEKIWEGCGGLILTDEVRVTIAAQACMLILALGQDYLSEISTILVYPRGFTVPTAEQDGVLVTESEVPTLGEAHVQGPVILAWEDVVRTGRDPFSGENLVYHEFAHQLDFVDGISDGTPTLSTAAEYRAWCEGMGEAFETLRRETEAGRDTFLGGYAASDAGEFFAVATERFFDLPEELQALHPKVYDLLRAFYRQDPARRMQESSGARGLRAEEIA
jgi:MtfA peptidase